MDEENTTLYYTLSTSLKSRPTKVGGQSYTARTKNTGSLDNDELLAAVAKASGADEEYIRYLDSVRRREILKALRAGKKLFLDGVVLAATVRGKFDTVDGEFDANRNSVVVTGYTYGALQDGLSDLVPQNVVTGGKPMLSRILEAGQVKDEVLVTGQNVTVTGRDLAPSADATDEGVSLINGKTGEVVATAQLVSSNLVEVVCSFASLPPAGQYQFVVSTRSGNGAEYKVTTASREVVVK